MTFGSHEHQIKWWQVSTGELQTVQGSTHLGTQGSICRWEYAGIPADRVVGGTGMKCPCTFGSSSGRSIKQSWLWT